MGTQAVQQPDRALGVGHADVHVQGEGRLAASDPAHGVLDHLVAPGRRDLRVLGHLPRVHARHGRRQPHRPCVAGQSFP